MNTIQCPCCGLAGDEHSLRHLCRECRGRGVVKPTLQNELLDLLERHNVCLESNCHSIMGVSFSTGFDRRRQEDWIHNTIMDSKNHY